MRQLILTPLLLVLLTTNVLAEELKMGILLPLTGELGYIGQACKNGVEMSVKDLDKATADKLKLIYEDDALQMKTSVAAFKKLVNQDKIDLAMSFSSGTSKAMGPIADSHKVPLIAIASDKGVVDGRTHVVNLWVTPETQAQLLREEIEKRGYKKVAVISATHNGTQAFLAAFNSVKGDLKVLLEDEYLTDARDFKPFIVKAKANPEIEAIFLNLFFGQTGTFAKQARELGLTQPFFAIEVVEDKQELETSKGALAGTWYIQADDGKQNFLDKYKKSYGDYSSYTSANCYDAIQLAAQWIKQDMNTEGFVSYLKTLKDYTGALGTYSATNDNRFTLPAVVKVVEKDGFRKLG